MMLQRKGEVQRACKKGRHREADEQMHAFGRCFSANPNAPLPNIPRASVAADCVSPWSCRQAAMPHQAAVARLQREAELSDRLRGRVEDDLEGTFWGARFRGKTVCSTGEKS